MNELEDSGPDAHTYWVVSWLLAVCTAGVLARLLFYLGGAQRPHTAFFLWLALLVVLSTFSAAAAVVAGVKNAETRTATRLARLVETGRPSTDDTRP